MAHSAQTECPDRPDRVCHFVQPDQRRRGDRQPEVYYLVIAFQSYNYIIQLYLSNNNNDHVIFE